MKLFRHGDWHFVETKEPMKGKKIKHKGSFTFAEGEATGHFHTLTVEKEKDMVFTKLPDGSYMVELKTQAKATHPEHSIKGDLVVAPARYKLIQRREKDWFQLVTRRVID